MLSKKPIRTYQRKPTKKPFINSSAVSSDFVGNSRFRNELFNDSLNYDPFETTFDRLAKEVV